MSEHWLLWGVEKEGDKIESGEWSQWHSEGLYLKQRSTLPAWRPPRSDNKGAVWVVCAGSGKRALLSYFGALL